MKKHLLFFALFALASCVKEEEYTCECVYDDGNGNTDTTSTNYYSTPENADNVCSAESISSDPNTTCHYY